MDMWFDIRGSGPDTYRVEVRSRGGMLLMDCTCQAGARGIHCKHRFALLEGDDGAIIEASHTVADLVHAAEGTKVQSLLKKLRDLERQADLVAKEIARAKKQIAREMVG